MKLPRLLPKGKPGRRTAQFRCRPHLLWVRKHACSVPQCKWDGIIQAAHVRRGSGAGMGEKPGDDRTVSLCRGHHSQQHAIGEAAFERKHGLDLVALAALFWAESPYRSHKAIWERGR